MEKKYEIDNNGICLNKCKFIDVQIGSYSCSLCDYNFGVDEDNKVVKCNAEYMI